MYGTVPEAGAPYRSRGGVAATAAEGRRLLGLEGETTLLDLFQDWGLLLHDGHLTLRGFTATGMALAMTVLAATLLLFVPNPPSSTSATSRGPPPPPRKAPLPAFQPPPTVKCPTGHIDVFGVCHDRNDFLTAPDAGGERVFVFENRATVAVWMGGLGPPHFKPRRNVTGFHLPPGGSFAVSLPSDLDFFRFWPRTGCRNVLEAISLNGEDVNVTKLRCQTGDCGSLENNFGVECLTASGLPPASLVEFQLSNRKNDFYDLSNVDGYNMGIRVVPYNYEPAADVAKNNCGSPTCVMDTGLCPEELQWVDGEGMTHCLSICKAIYSERQRAEHEVLQDLYDAPTDRGWMRDYLCCQCGESAAGSLATPTCEGLSLKCTYGCSPFMDYGGDANYRTRKCDRIPGTYLPAWPNATNGDNYAAVFYNQCPQSYSWQFNDYQNTHQCRHADYKIQILSR